MILATDGDFNVGIADPEELQGYVARKRAGGVFLSVLGFGTGNYNDALMQRLAQNGNGNAAYIDSLSEARKVLVQEARPSGGFENEFATISIRHKKPDAKASTPIARHVTPADMFESAESTPRDIRFAAAVAAFGQLLRGGRYTGNYGYDDVIAAAHAARGEDPFGYRAGLIGLVHLAKSARRRRRSSRRAGHPSVPGGFQPKGFHIRINFGNTVSAARRAMNIAAAVNTPK